MPRGRGPTLAGAAAVALRWTWPLLLVIAVFVAVGGVGFSPTDEGLIQANAQRILRGEIPHLDVISPRPLGSAYLHAIDLVLPTPLVATSRFLALCQIAVYTVALACLALRRGPGRWSVTASVLVAAAILVNVHTFPVTAWHTIDGLFLTCIGFLLLAVGLARRRRLLTDLAMVVLGGAAIVKQSFVPALVLGMAWVVIDAWPRGGRAVARRALEAVGFGLVPAVAYGLMLAAAGGIGEAWLQLTSGGDAVADTVLDELDRALGDGVVAFVGLTAMLVLGVLERLARRGGETTHAVRVAALLARVVVIAVVVEITVAGRLELYGSWGVLLLLLALGTIVQGLLAGRGLDGIALLTASIAGMSMLSWGYAVPDLVGGSLAFLVLHREWEMVGIELPAWATARTAAVATAGVAVCVLVVVSAVLYDERTSNVYRFPRDADLSVDLGAIDDDFWGIKANRSMARYLRQVRDCVEEYPAARVAILPDNAMLSPVFGLENPFPSDWMLLDELADSRPVVIEAARRLDRAGDYLVLFETMPAHLAGYQDAPAEVPLDSDIYFYFDDLGEQIRDALSGRPVSCGSFVGVYSPPGSDEADT